ncbi:hypothetical protein M378DRAFT_170162 [Amanita muscaria Koide BX008]|uniref:Uncharacterized protein n=1 Tax=Amanita muscaria (strain Koide BX008) TaxID=946122 RepID=A0A0C2WQ04_AMAMK|nr:hypothetical protein M378DRAFT_170162 [Amanita muscaria Koide BX008]
MPYASYASQTRPTPYAHGVMSKLCLRRHRVPVHSFTRYRTTHCPSPLIQVLIPTSIVSPSLTDSNIRILPLAFSHSFTLSTRYCAAVVFVSTVSMCTCFVMIMCIWLID